MKSALVASLAGLVVIASGSMASAVSPGDTVFIGEYNSHFFPVWNSSDTSGPPDFWAYCVEHDVSSRSNAEGVVGDLSDYLGENFFTESSVQGTVLWILANSYPALSLEEFEATSGADGITVEDAIEATQYAIWRYTELTWDADWAWRSSQSEIAYWFLVNSARNAAGLTPADFEVSVAITPTSVAQSAGSLIGPITINTNQASVAVSVSPAMGVVDAGGNPIDTGAVVDGQELYLDALSVTAAGAASIIASATGSSGSGKIVSVPITDGATPTGDEHAQTIALIAANTATTTVEAAIAWTARHAGDSAGNAGPIEGLAATGPSTPIAAVFTVGIVSLLFGVVLRARKRSRIS